MSANSQRTHVLTLGPIYKARCGGMCLESNFWRGRERIPGLQDWSGTLSHKLWLGTGEMTPWLKSFLSTHEDRHPHNQTGVSCTPLTSPAPCPWTQEDCSDLQPCSQQKKCRSRVPGETYLKGAGGECWKRTRDTFFWPLCMHTSMCAHMHTHTRVVTHIHK